MTALERRWLEIQLANAHGKEDAASRYIRETVPQALTNPAPAPARPAGGTSSLVERAYRYQPTFGSFDRRR